MFLLQGTTRKNTPFVFVMSKGHYLWRILREWLNTNVNIEISIEYTEILFSYNHIYDLAKLYVYQNKFISRYINIQGSFAP